MRKLCFLLLFLLFSLFVYASNIPQPQGWLNDFANVISNEYRDKLTALIQELEEKTSAEVAVVTAQSIAPYDEKEYARLLFDNWRPGKKGKDNGVLVLLVIKERRWRIETGYGIEGILPDGLCGEIGRNYMVPYFKAGKYGEGLYQGVTVISQTIARDAKVELDNLRGINLLKRERDITKGEIKYKAFALIFGLVIVLFGNLLYFLLGVGLIWAFFGFPTGKSFLIFFVIASILRYLFLRFIPKPRFDQTVTWRNYWGGGFSSGDFGGGGFGGGGFGGFGGGGGGGGGAGGGF